MSGGNAGDPTTSDETARQTEDVVWRTTVPGAHVRAGSRELSTGGSFPGCAGNVATPGRPSTASGRMLSEAAPRRPPEPGEQQASEGRRRLLRSVATGVVATRNRNRETWAERSWPASRRPELIYRFGISPPRVTRGMEIDWNALVSRTRAQLMNEMVVRIAYY